MGSLPMKAVETPSKRLLYARLASGLRTVGEGVAELLWPTRCVLCDVPGTLLCNECRLEISYIDPIHACPYCGQAHGRYACVDCNSFMMKHRGLAIERGEQRQSSEVLTKNDMTKSPLDRIASVFEFANPCRKLITSYKDRKEIRLASLLAGLLNDYLNPSWILPGKTALVIVPARKQAVRERGFDHMQQIGKCLANLSGLPLLDLIEPQERGDQRGLSAARRQQNMRNSFVAKRANGKNVKHFGVQSVRASGSSYDHEQSCPTFVFTQQLPNRVILVDDVLTTGATLTAAAIALKEMGINQVFGLTLGRIP